MKFSQKYIFVFLFICVIISLTLGVIKFGEAPRCLNADEAAFGYNAYSILKTGKDEYGNFLPLRLKSFGDYKLPLYSYLSIPFISLFGLNEFSTRSLAILIGALFPLAIYFLSKEIFKDDRVSLAAAFLTSLSLWLHIFSRQAHEATLAAFLLTLSFIFLTRFIKRNNWIDFSLLSICIGLGLFSYHIVRIPALFIFIFIVYYLLKKSKFPKKKSLALIIIFLVPILFFIYGDIKYNPARLGSLVFYKTQGFSLKIDELRAEHNFRLLHNKVTQTLLDLPKEYIKYFSPEFLTIRGDAENPRFGFDGLPPLTLIEYLFFIIGVYYLFKNRQEYRYFLLFLILVSPLSASISWQSYSLARSFYLFVPIMLTASYGFISLIDTSNKRKHIYVALLVGAYLILSFYSWDFYFMHYPKRALVIRAWECGYKEVGSLVKNNYQKFDRFIITDRLGQPYIFLLYYLTWNPANYQMQSNLSGKDKYGFGQVLKFDKFDFRFHFDGDDSKKVYVGFPDDFSSVNIDQKKLKKITVGSEEMFDIYGI